MFRAGSDRTGRGGQGRMRKTFQRELERLDQDVVRMGALVETAIESVILALVEGDLDRAKKVMEGDDEIDLSLIHISEPTRLRRISYAVFCLKKKNTTKHKKQR